MLQRRRPPRLGTATPSADHILLGGWNNPNKHRSCRGESESRGEAVDLIRKQCEQLMERHHCFGGQEVADVPWKQKK